MYVRITYVEYSDSWSKSSSYQMVYPKSSFYIVYTYNYNWTYRTHYKEISTLYSDYGSKSNIYSINLSLPNRTNVIDDDISEIRYKLHYFYDEILQKLNEFQYFLVAKNYLTSIVRIVYIMGNMKEIYRNTLNTGCRIWDFS